MAAPETVIPTYVQPAPLAPIPSERERSSPGRSEGGGTGGLVDRNKIINDGVQNGINQAQQLMQMRREQLDWQARQADKTAGAHTGPPAGIPSGPSTPAEASWHENLMHGLSAVGAGVKQIFGGTPDAPPAGIPAPVAGPPPAAIAANTPDAPAPDMPGTIPGAPAMDAMMKGGPVTTNLGSDVTTDRSWEGLIGMESPARQSVLPYMNGGVIRGYENGGTISADAPPAAIAAPDAPAQSPQDEMTHQVDELFKSMHGAALGDDHVPNNSRGMPAPAADTGPPPDSAAAPAAQGADAPAAPQDTAPAAPSAAGTPPQGIAAPKDPTVPDPQDPKVQASAAAAKSVIDLPPTDPAKTGVETTSPSAEGKPHSITKEQWEDWDNRIEKAVSAAALAGRDPGQVRQALEASRNSYIQGHVLRYLSAAHIAMQSGDMKGVEAAMKNAYYYMPNGQDLKIQKDKSGNLLYQDPITPTVLDVNNVSHPNLIPVDAQHIELLGQAMLDPMQVNKTLMEIRTAHRQQLDSEAKRELEKQQGLAARDTGQGNLRKGQGILEGGDAHVARVKSQNYRDLAEGDAALIRAKAVDFKLRNTIHANKLDPGLLKGSQEASDGFEKAVQGQLSTGAGANDPNTLNPAAGKTYRDPEKSALPGATPRDIASGKAYAGQIFLGAAGAMSTGRAIELAIMASQAKKASSLKPDPKTGKMTKSPDFHTDPKTGDSWVWNKGLNKWETFKLPLTSANAAASGNLGVTEADLDDATKAELASNGGVGAGRSSAEPAIQDEPDMKDQEFPAEQPS